MTARQAVARFIAERLRWPRRILILWCTGVLWVAVGVGVWTAAPTLNRFGEQIAPFDAVLNSHWSAGLWVACGLFGMVTAIRGRGRVRGFGGLVAPPLLWMLLYDWSWFTWWATGGLYGSGRAWVSATTWAIPVFFLMITAGWREESPVPLPAEELFPPPPDDLGSIE